MDKIKKLIPDLVALGKKLTESLDDGRLTPGEIIGVGMKLPAFVDDWRNRKEIARELKEFVTEFSFEKLEELVVITVRSAGDFNNQTVLNYFGKGLEFYTVLVSDKQYSNSDIQNIITKL